MGSKVLSVTLPEELYRRLDEERAKGHYTRSEFVRIALRRMMGIPYEDPLPEEVEAIEQGRADYARGERVDWEDVKRDLKLEV